MAREWDVGAAVAACPMHPWRGEAWRCHTRRWPGDNADGSLRVTGRYHRGRDQYPEDETWPALYTGLAEHIALGEALRHTRYLPDLAGKRITRLAIELAAVLDGTGLVDAGWPGALTLDDLCRPADYSLTHAIAVAVCARNAEALLIPTCTRFTGTNLIVFPDLVGPGSSTSMVSSEDPDLYIDWDEVDSMS